ncbi:MAG: hypothetical protein GKR87_09440 [Kiritimatiellae bacterium]|nr:hypothetical protein [Kiritimatiellia bacterium]
MLNTENKFSNKNFLMSRYGFLVDFVAVENEKPLWAIECKWSDMAVSKSLKYSRNKFPACEVWQLSATGTRNYITKENIHVAHATSFLTTLV